MSNAEREEVAVRFGAAEVLELHQLRLLEWMVNTGEKRDADNKSDDQEEPALLPEKWRLTEGIEPYKWQQDCIEKWFENGGRGTVKVVTGGGKTLLAMSIAEHLQNQRQPDLRLVVVVPTIVLMHQWYDAIIEHGNIPSRAIGRLGGGYDEDFSNDRRILIAVLASASRRLARMVKEARVAKQLLLVADECHRAGAKEMSQVFKTERAWSLGLSATPEREDDVDAGYDESLLGREVGPIIYEFNLADALHEGLVPKFAINHYGLPMTAAERNRYETLSRSISDAMSTLRNYRDARTDGDFFSWARSIAVRNKGEMGAVALRFVADSSKRRELLNRMRSRHKAVERLIESEFAVNKDARVILFHESIDEVMDLYVRLRQRGFPVIAEHSELPGSIRETGLDLFRKGIAQIIVSARSLIEGFNVPAVDVGIIVASSGSVRQRIQSLGRVLRRHRGIGGEEKTSCIHSLYAADSVEENIYGKLDWNATTGVDRNRYFIWDPVDEPREQDGPPKTPLPADTQVDRGSLEPGCVYPGQYEGIELSCDSQKNVRNDEGQYSKDTSELADAVFAIKGSAGRFRVTPNQRYVLVRVPAAVEWETRYVTQLASPLEFDTPQEVRTADVDLEAWIKSARLGDAYPCSSFATIDEDLRFKRKGGGVITKKVPGGELFAREGERAQDPAKGADAARLVKAVLELHNKGKNVSKIEINEAGHVVFREAGRLFFICALGKGLEFPEGILHG
jgi:superfamily II DNA or RNA helicase